MPRATVSLARAGSRYDSVTRCLEQVRSEIDATASGRRRFLVKPNIVSVTRELATTHLDAVRAVIDQISHLGPKHVVVGEGSTGGTWTGFSNFGYTRLAKDYGVELVDFNEDE